MVTEPYPGKEEYLNSEKYEIKHWDWTVKNKLIHLITKLNQIRKDHPALQQTNNIHFCRIENEQLLAFYKWDEERKDELLIVVSLDSNHVQQGYVQVPLDFMGVAAGTPLEFYDLLTQTTYKWQSEWNFIELQPNLPFHLFHIRR